ncbi:MAG: leucyl/phenylalanyl-tRNA--protein transferase [Gammaproteobacteria bacterium]|nr:leucyl/phenylalanyl-tRNA--protein transferase [Gammaproteobacteria bacterium]
MSHPIYWLNEDPCLFPQHKYALKDPNGLLAAGGDLSIERLLYAYSLGIFPWYNSNEPILWWSPSPRSVIRPSQFKPSRSLAKFIRKGLYTVTSDTCFADVMRSCAAPRNDQNGTWINQDMIKAYTKLHEIGFAHSVECWQNDELIGGLYGIAIGKAFFGESMFSTKDNASKVAFAVLCENLSSWGFEIIDCQVHNPHLESLGAIEIPREEFLDILDRATAEKPDKEWQFG